MKRTLIVLSIAMLALPATSFAKGPSEASITGPGLGKAIKITGPEQDGSAMMNFADAAGFFPGAFGQEPSPLLPSRPKGDLDRSTRSSTPFRAGKSTRTGSSRTSGRMRSHTP